MGIQIQTASGKVFPVDAVTPGSLYPVLHIHTSSLSGAEAYSVFSDPAETAVLEEIRDVEVIGTDERGKETKTQAQRHRRFTGFTNLYSVGPSPLVPGAILIWLTRPAEAESEKIFEEDAE